MNRKAVTRTVRCALLLLVFGVVAAMLPAQTGQVLELTTPRIHNSAVVDLQRFLAWSGYSLGTDGIDGWFGNDTESAVRRYQRDAGMEATGRIRLSEIDFNLTFEPTVEGMLDGNIPASLALGEIWLDEEYHTYFGRFRAEHFYDIPRNMMRIESIGSDALYVEVENDMGKVSPSGRFISVEEIDFYAGDGASALVIADLVSGGVARFEYASFLDGRDVGLRSAFYRTEARWIGDGELALHLTIDYPGDSGHPGIDANRAEQLGDKWGTSDPIDLGWFLISMNAAPAPAEATIWSSSSLE